MKKERKGNKQWQQGGMEYGNISRKKEERKTEEKEWKKKTVKKWKKK